MTALSLNDDPGPQPSGLGPAFLVALLLHAAAVTGLALYTPTQPAPPGESIVSIDLAPQMIEAESQAPSETARSEAIPDLAKPEGEPEAVNPVETPEEAKPPPPPETAEIRPDEATPPPPTEMTQVMPDEAKPPPPPVEALTQAVPETPPPPPEEQVITSQAQEAEPLAPPPPVEVAKPKPQEPDPAKLAAEQEARRRAAIERKREAEREQRRLEALAEKREAEREARLKAAAKAKADRDAARRAQAAVEGNAQRNSAASSRQNSTGAAARGNDPNALRAWQGALSAAIHGRMNRNAAAGTAGGVAVVRFTVSRTGQVLSAGLASASGIGAIDSAALAAVRGTLPAAPPGFTDSSLAVTVPLRFSPGR
jgi:protein TonB